MYSPMKIWSKQSLALGIRLILIFSVNGLGKICILQWKFCQNKWGNQFSENKGSSKSCKVLENPEWKMKWQHTKSEWEDWKFAQGRKVGVQFWMAWFKWEATFVDNSIF